MNRRIPHLAIALFLALVALVALPSTAIAADKDCGDFATQKAAQDFFINNGGSKTNDPHALDADGDGVACESNPCPCSTSQTPSGGGGGSTAPQPKAEPAQVKQKAKIVKVIDGDTVDAKLIPGGPQVRVRMIGIDTPEVYGGTECGGPEASRSAKKTLPRGTRVLLVSDPSQDLKDRYGRLLRYVMKKATDVNRLQIKRGHAEVYVYNNNPFNRVTKYRAAQAQAKKNNLGMWGKC